MATFLTVFILRIIESTRDIGLLLNKEVMEEVFFKWNFLDLSFEPTLVFVNLKHVSMLLVSVLLSPISR